MGYRQIKFSSKDYLDDVATCDVSLEYILMSVGLNNSFALFITYDSIFLEYLNKFVAETIDNILIFSMLEKIHMEQLALMLEIFENRLRVTLKNVFWML